MCKNNIVIDCVCVCLNVPLLKVEQATASQVVVRCRRVLCLVCRAPGVELFQIQKCYVSCTGHLMLSCVRCRSVVSSVQVTSC